MQIKHEGDACALSKASLGLHQGVPGANPRRRRVCTARHAHEHGVTTKLKRGMTYLSGTCTRPLQRALEPYGFGTFEFRTFANRSVGARRSHCYHTRVARLVRPSRDQQGSHVLQDYCWAAMICYEQLHEVVSCHSCACPNTRMADVASCGLERH
jgi:hypothetical protein